MVDAGSAFGQTVPNHLPFQITTLYLILSVQRFISLYLLWSSHFIPKLFKFVSSFSDWNDINGQRVVDVSCHGKPVSLSLHLVLSPDCCQPVYVSNMHTLNREVTFAVLYM